MTQRARSLKRRHTGSTSACVFLAGLISTPAPAQENGDPEVSKEAPSGRISRLQDALDNTGEWDITGVPQLQAGPSFEDRIRAGTALGSEAYRALDSALRRTQQALAECPDDQQARRQLLEIRRALAARAETNMNLGYRYAARVYIALLEDAGAPPEQVATYRQRLAQLPQS